MFVSENHGYMTVCHGDDFVSCASAAALDEVDLDTSHGLDPQRLVEVTEGKHLGRTIRWSPQGIEWESDRSDSKHVEWESDSKHVEDMVEFRGLKLESKGAPTPITKATGRGRRDIDNTLNATDAQTFRQAAGTGSTCRSIVHHSSLRCPW